MIKLKSLLTEEQVTTKEYTLPKDHKPAMRVPKGGSMCLNCKFLGDDKKSCTEDNFIKWNNGSGKLPYPADEFCSDFYEPKQEI